MASQCVPLSRARAPLTPRPSAAAYFSQPTLDSLGTIDGIPGVGGVYVPEGWFRSARASKAKRAENASGDEVSPAPEPWAFAVPSSGPLDAPPLSAYHARPPRTPLDYYAPDGIPSLADAGLKAAAFRAPSPYTQSQSSSSSSSSSPRPFSPPLGARELVPLAYLQGLAPAPARDPLDEHLLRRLAGAPPWLRDRDARAQEDAKPAVAHWPACKLSPQAGV